MFERLVCKGYLLLRLQPLQACLTLCLSIAGGSAVVMLAVELAMLS